MSHFKTLSWKQEALFCPELADAWVEILDLVMGTEPELLQIWQNWLHIAFVESVLCGVSTH